MYPVCLHIAGQLCTVIGGGAVAERKVLSLLEAEAQVRVISPDVTEALADLSATGKIEWLPRGYCQGDLAGALLVFAATDNRAVQAAVVDDAQQAGQLMNIADAPEQCSFHVPALVRRGDLALTVSTNGKSPALAAKIRKQLAEDFGEEYASLLKLTARIREHILATYTDGNERKLLFQNILQGDILLWIKNGHWEQLHNHLENLLGPDKAIDDLLDSIRN